MLYEAQKRSRRIAVGSNSGRQFSVVTPQEGEGIVSEAAGRRSQYVDALLKPLPCRPSVSARACQMRPHQYVAHIDP
jgi:hypothetical protein